MTGGAAIMSSLTSHRYTCKFILQNPIPSAERPKLQQLAEASRALLATHSASKAKCLF